MFYFVLLISLAWLAIFEKKQIVAVYMSSINEPRNPESYLPFSEDTLLLPRNTWNILRRLSTHSALLPKEETSYNFPS